MSEATHIDVNLTSLYEKTGVVLDPATASTDTPGAYDTPLKISHSQMISGAGLWVPQGNENAVDIDLSQGVNLEGHFGGGPVTGRQVITVKGGSTNIALKGTILTAAPASGVHVDIGNWMDQSYGLTRNVTLDLERPDGRPVYVRIGWAKPFSVKLGGHCEYLLWKSVQLKAYIVFKFLIRILLRIPKGTKGPAWL